MAEIDRTHAIAYIVSAWPRLSETFILNEVIAVERHGVPLRIFSIKDPAPGPVHATVARVRAEFTCLAQARHWWFALRPSLRLITKHPARYCRTLLQAVRLRRSRGGRHFFQAICLADTLSREPVSHLHAHFANAPALVAMFTHRLTGIPYTFTAHAKDIYVKTPPELLRAEVERAQAVITCTEYNRRYLLDQLGMAFGGKLHCIYHGLDLSQFKFRPPRLCEPGPPVILSVARLVDKKGLSTLITAADILRRRGRRFSVQIIGDGPGRQALEAHVTEHKLEDRVKLLGAQPHEVVHVAYQRASVFALPSIIAADGDRDGIPNVLVEAMASGVPVVSTPVSGIPELINSEQEGLLVQPKCPEALADALERLLTDAKLGERLAQAARAKIEACFSVDQNARRLLALFRRETTSTDSALALEPVFQGEHRKYSAEAR